MFSPVSRVRRTTVIAAAFGVTFGVTLGVTFGATTPALAAPADAAAPRTMYVSASRLNMRTQPAPEAELLTRWKINQTLTLVKQVDARWCAVQAPADTANPALRQGFVDCRYLQDHPVRLIDTEIEATNLILSLNRLAAAHASPEAYGSLPWAQAFTEHTTEARAQLEALLDQMDRHFALSPSMRTYADYNGLLGFLSSLSTPEKPLPEPITSLVGRRLALLPLMRAAFTADFAAQPAEPVRRSITASLTKLINARQASLSEVAPPGAVPTSPPTNQIANRAGAFDLNAPPPGASFFSEGRWAIGWAPLVTAVEDGASGSSGAARAGATGDAAAGGGSEGAGSSAHKAGRKGGAASGKAGRAERAPTESVYRFHYSGSGPWAVGDTIEMAKALRASVRTSFRYLTTDGSNTGFELSQMKRTAEGAFEASTVQTSLQAWAITDDGLVPGKLRQVVFAGDACSSGAGDTAAEFVFAKPLPATVHGVFISSAPIDAAHAKVTVHRRSFLAPLLSDENTLTSETIVEVDLNGDGIPDLRSRVSTDTSVSGWFGARTRRVGGWYAYDVESLEMNEGGRWRMLSIYDVVTCT